MNSKNKQKERLAVSSCPDGEIATNNGSVCCDSEQVYYKDSVKSCCNGETPVKWENGNYTDCCSSGQVYKKKWA